MIVYENTAQGFIADVQENRIEDNILRAFIPRFGMPTSSQRMSWQNSMRFMETAVSRASVAEDCGILIEYNVPSAGRMRIDFLIAGKDDEGGNNFIIVELKQWQWAKSTHRSGIVKAPLHGIKDGVETTHPSYQAHSYKMFLNDFKESVYNGDITSHACAYLHNYREGNPEPLKEDIYKEVVSQAPIYFKDDVTKLSGFIRRFVGKGSGKEILYEIEKGRIRPSRKLVDYVCALYKGNPAFVLIDEQKVAYEKAIDLALTAKKKTMLLIKGGPGTGKSVVSMNVLAGLLSDQSNVAFIAPNASFRDVMVQSLARENSVMRLRSLFKGSSSFYGLEANVYDALVVDEAHRLKNGTAYQYQGENQIEDIVNAARVSIFFIDDDQKIRPEDIGSVSELRRVAEKFKADIHEIEIVAQFRCSGADGYINWLDDVLRIRPTGNFDGWDAHSFEFKIFDDPNQLYQAIRVKDVAGSKARMLAGYAWPWTKEGNVDGEVCDVAIPDKNFAMPWNSRQVGTTWAIDADGIGQVGCIHTAQGLEFDYVGVIVGKDLSFDDKTGTFRVDWDEYYDRNGKKGLRNKSEQLSKLVRNIYKTLMTRGMKGCYVYFVNKELEAYFRSKLSVQEAKPIFVSDLVPVQEQQQILIQEQIDAALEFIEYLPVYSLEAACGKFGHGQTAREDGWVRVKIGRKLHKEMFVVRAVGDSMEPRINNNDYCVFEKDRGGTRDDKIVLVECRDSVDPDSGKYTIKKYLSEKVEGPDEVVVKPKISLIPSNRKHETIVLYPDSGDELTVVGWHVETLGRSG